MKQPKCSFCDGKLRAGTPLGPPFESDPCFRCLDCNVRIMVTNPSYLPPELVTFYWHLVKSQTINKQEWDNE